MLVNYKYTKMKADIPLKSVLGLTAKNVLK